MGARFLLIGTISICLFRRQRGCASAKRTGTAEVLPASRYAAGDIGKTRPQPECAPGCPEFAAGFCLSDRATATASSGMDVDKVPSHQRTRRQSNRRTGSLNIADALQQTGAGVVVNEVSGNPFQPNVEFRGFVASPVNGTPQGLAV